MDFLKQLEARREELLEEVKALDTVIESERRRVGPIISIPPEGVTVADRLTVKLTGVRPRGEFSRAVLSALGASGKSMKPIEVTRVLQGQGFDFGGGKTPVATRVSNELSRLFNAETIRRRKGRYSMTKTGDSHG